MSRRTPHAVQRVALALGLALAAGAPALADGPPVSFSFSIGTPPVYAPAPGYVAPALVAPGPSMVWDPGLGAYVALGVQQPLFYFGGVYYYLYGGRWYAGPQYGGPWRPVLPPPPLRRFEGHDWDRYQRYARDHARDPHWRHFRPGDWHGAPQRGYARPGYPERAHPPAGYQQRGAPAPGRPGGPAWRDQRGPGPHGPGGPDRRGPPGRDPRDHGGPRGGDR